MVVKLSTLLGELALSKRRRACRYLVKLYYAIVALDDTTERILHSVASGASAGHRHIHVSGLAGRAGFIRVCLKRLCGPKPGLATRSWTSRSSVTSTLSPDLSREGQFPECYRLLASTRISANHRQFAFWMPTESLLHTDFEGAYRQSVETIKRGEEYYWPSDAFDYFQDTEEPLITPDSDDSARKLLAALGQHHQKLKQAREQLRTLLKESFFCSDMSVATARGR